MKDVKGYAVSRVAAGILVLVLMFFGTALAEDVTEREEGFFELFDDMGRRLTMTARVLGQGDGYISSDNRYYVVDRVEGDKILLKYKETVELPEVDTMAFSRTSKSITTRVGGILDNLFVQTSQSKAKQDTIAIYVTHGDESYVPTSGKASEEKGDVYNVAHALGDALKRLGYEVVVSENSHLPRDGEAYLRSRRTAFDLLKKYQPATIIDIHRDAVPAEVYKTEVNGQEMTKVRLVVGRQNQNRSANLEYAKRIKAYADKHYPGLIEGIFDARGNYNQDLSPRAILLEFGTHTTSEEQAKAAAQIMARVLPAAAGLSGARDSAQSGGQEQKQQAVSYIGAAGMKTLWWIIGIGALIIIGLAFVNTSKGKLFRGLFRRESSQAIGLPQSQETDKATENNEEQNESRDGDDNHLE